MARGRISASFYALLALGVVTGCDCAEDPPTGSGRDAGGVAADSGLDRTDSGPTADAGDGLDGGGRTDGSTVDAGGLDAGLEDAMTSGDAGGADAMTGGDAGDGDASAGADGSMGGNDGGSGDGSTGLGDGSTGLGDGGSGDSSTGLGDGGLGDGSTGLGDGGLGGADGGAGPDAGPNPDPRTVVSTPYGRVSPGGGNGVDTDAAGHVYVVGTTSSFTDFFGMTTHNRLGASDAFLVSFDPSAGHRWSRRFGVAGGVVDTEGLAARVGPDGHLYVAGTTRGGLDLGGGPLPVTGDALWVASFTAAGVHRWSRAVAGDHDHVRLAVAHDRVYVASELDGSYGFAGATHATRGGTDIVLLAYDALGAERWTRRVTAVDPSIMPPQPRAEDFRDGGLAASAAGVWLVGETNHSHLDLGGGPVLVNAIGRCFLVSFDENGSAPSAAALNTLADPRALAVDEAGRMFIATRVGATSSAMLLAYYTLSGRTPSFQWTLSFTRGGERNVFGLRIDDLGRAHFAGYFRDRLDLSGRALLWAPTSNGFGLFVAVFDTAGSLARSAVFDFAIAADLAVDPWHRDYLTGAYGGTPDFGDGPLPNPLPSGSQAYFLLRSGP